jgi:hypothetical protein
MVVANGRWKINTGTNTLTLYMLDGTTVYKTFNLKDASGNPTTTNVFERA